MCKYFNQQENVQTFHSPGKCVTISFCRKMCKHFTHQLLVDKTQHGNFFTHQENMQIFQSGKCAFIKLRNDCTFNQPENVEIFQSTGLIQLWRQYLYRKCTLQPQIWSPQSAATLIVSRKDRKWLTCPCILYNHHTLPALFMAPLIRMTLGSVFMCFWSETSSLLVWEFSGKPPLSSYETTLKQQFKIEKWDVELRHFMCFRLSSVVSGTTAREDVCFLVCFSVPFLSVQPMRLHCFVPLS